MNQNLKLANTVITNIVQWLMGEVDLDRTEWTEELLQLFDLETQNKIFEQFHHLGQIVNVGQLKRYFNTYFIELDYDSSSWFLSININKEGKIQNILITQNAKKMSSELTIPHNLNESIQQHYVDILIDYDLTIEGCITLPKQHTPKALVLFIHGSGASNKDENVGYCAPFYDLALGLAQHKIASIRFDKRGWSYPFIPIIEPLDEIINDAVQAGNLLCHHFQHDNLPLIIIGHSQGASFVTQISEKLETRPRGLVLLAAPSSNDIHASLLHQLDYLIQKNLGNSEELKKIKHDVQISQLNWKNYQSDKSTNVSFIFNYTPEYLTYLDANPPIELIRRSNLPTFILQGQQDYKVLARKDFRDWKTQLIHKKNVSYKMYQNLEHCFVNSQDAQTNTFTQVNADVIQDIADWILIIIEKVIVNKEKFD